MPVPTTWSKKEDIPQEFLPLLEKGYIVEGDAGFRLDSAELRHFKTELRDHKEKHGTLQKQLESAQRAAEEAEALREQIAEIESRQAMGDDAGQIQKLLDEHLETAEVGDQVFRLHRAERGRFEKFVTGLQKQVSDLQKRYEAADGEVRKNLYGSVVAEASTQIPGFRGPRADVEALLASRMRFPDPAKPYQGEIHDGAGKTVYDSDDQPIAPAAWIKQLCETPVTEGGRAGIWTPEPTKTPGIDGAPLGGAPITDMAAALKRR